MSIATTTLLVLFNKEANTYYKNRKAALLGTASDDFIFIGGSNFVVAEALAVVI